MGATTLPFRLPVELGEVVAGKYRLDRVLGVGGMGVVVLATHLSLEEHVAIKFLRPGAVGDPTAHARFLREARAGARIKSEHVVRVLDVAALHDGTSYIVMEYLEGIDLDALLQRRGTFPIEETCDYVLQACEGIAQAHVAGVVHRDLKPSNLFVTMRADGSTLVKIFDFGISKVRPKGGAAEQSLTQTSSTVVGSPLYMSPEQMRGDRDLDHRCDIWALGILLYELATGTYPFAGDSLTQLCSMVLTTRPLPPSARNLSIPPAFDQVVLRCLEKRASDRFANVAELAAALAPLAPVHAQLACGRIAAVIAGPRQAPPPSWPGLDPISIPPSSASTIGGASATHGFSPRLDWIRFVAAVSVGLALAGVLLILVLVVRPGPRRAAASTDASEMARGPLLPPPPPNLSAGTSASAPPDEAADLPAPSITDPAVTSSAPSARSPVARVANDAGVRSGASRKTPSPSRSAYGGRD